MARRVTVINEVRDQSKNPVLVLDAGSTLTGQWLSLETDGRVIIDAMNAMSYDAMTVGQMDLAKGVDILLERAAEAKFPVLSSNLVGADGAPLLQPYALLDRDGLTIGIIGVTEVTALQGLGDRAAGASLLDPIESVRRYLDEIRPQVDLLIVLSHLGIDEDRILAGTTPGIDVIIGGLSRKLMAEPELVGTTLVTQMGYDGEWLGQLDLGLDAANKVVGVTSQIRLLQADVLEHPGMARLVNEYKEAHPEPTTVTE